MRLEELLTAMQSKEVIGPTGRTISGLYCDSRRVEPGGLFFALPGAERDGQEFIPQALEQGAVAVVTNRRPQQLSEAVCLVLVENVRRAMACAASCYYGQPTAGIPVIGITGTNGKTTVTYLLEAILRQAGMAPAVFGTVDYRFGGRSLQSTHTTPESHQLLRMMAEFRRQGADALVLEVSSHALEQHRADGIDFDVAVFTNLTPEHLDYHGDLEGYFASKRRLFSELLGAGTAVLNQDDPFGRRLLQEQPNGLSFGNQEQAKVRPVSLQSGREGIRGRFATPAGAVEIDSTMTGAFNVSNLLAAVAAASALGIDPQQIAAGIAGAAQVPGRLERVANDRGLLALVDYAHTGDALEQVLKTLSQLQAERLICLVGCGGDRDPAKRPVMAAAAVRYADLAVLTSDNPRSEDPLAILEQMRQGALAAGGVEISAGQPLAEQGSCFVVIPDRRQAIEFAAHCAASGDLLLVAGKGHEDYQILGTETVHFDDREELRRALAAGEGPR